MKLFAMAAISAAIGGYITFTGFLLFGPWSFFWTFPIAFFVGCLAGQEGTRS